LTITIVNKRNYFGEGIDCSRPNPLGNPASHLPKSTAPVKVKTRKEAIEYFAKLAETDRMIKSEITRLAKIYSRTGRLTLKCWCVPKSCHDP